MHKKSLYNSPRLLEIRNKKRRILRNKILIILGLIIIIFVGLCLVSRIQKLNVSEVEVKGNVVVDTKDIQKVVQDDMNGHFLWFLPKTNFILLPKNKIKKDLNETYKRLKDIELKTKSDGTLEVSVGERLGLYTWCGEALPKEGTKPEDNKCYFMDDAGYIFDQAPYFSNDVYFKFFGPINTDNPETPAGARYLPNTFPQVTKFIESIVDLKIQPSSILVGVDGEVSVYLSSKKLPPSAPKIVFNTHADLEKLAGNLEASVTSDPLQKDLKEKYESLEYIDLRFGNRVYYKFK